MKGCLWWVRLKVGDTLISWGTESFCSSMGTTQWGGEHLGAIHFTFTDPVLCRGHFRVGLSMGVTQPCSRGRQIAAEAACPLASPSCWMGPPHSGLTRRLGGPGLLQLSQVRLPTFQTCPLRCWGESMSGTQVVVVSTGGSRPEVRVQWTIISPRGNGIKGKAEGLAQTLGASWTEVPGKPWPQL